MSFAEAYLRHMNFVTRLDPGVIPLADSQFVVVPGLADPEAFSIESVNFPGFYLSHRSNAIVFLADDNSDTFEANATWWFKPGLADESAISFEAYSQPGSFIGQMFGTMALVKQTDSMSALAKKERRSLGAVNPTPAPPCVERGANKND